MNYKLNKEYWSKRYCEMGGKKTVGRKNWSSVEYDNFINKHFNDLKCCLVQYAKKGLVVDFGCGIGRWVPLLKDVFEEYIGVDIAEKAIKESKSKFPNLEFFLIRENLSLDIVPQTIWTHVVLQHIIDDRLLINYINQFNELLDDNGTVVITEACENKNYQNKYIVHKDKEKYLDIFEQSGFCLLYCNKYIENHHTMVFKRK